MKDNEKAITASSINILAGLWLVASPFFMGFSGTSAATNSIIVGVIVAILALVRAFSPMTTGSLSWVNMVLGLWMIVFSVFIASVGATAVWNGSILGLVIAILAIWSAQSAMHGMHHSM